MRQFHSNYFNGAIQNGLSEINFSTINATLQLQATSLEGLLNHLMRNRLVEAQTQALALSDLSFIYPDIIKPSSSLRLDFLKNQRLLSLAVVLTHDEVSRVIDRIATFFLLAALLYRKGLRLMG